MTHPLVAAPCTSCGPALNPARFSSGLSAIIGGGGLPLLNAEDGAIGPSPTNANFLSKLQLMLQDKGLAPAKLYGFAPNAPAPWYRPELPSEAKTASWNDYLDGVNLGTYRGGLLGLAAGAGIMLAALYFGGAMISSPKAAPAATPKVIPAIPVATSRHRRGRSSRKGR